MPRLVDELGGGDDLALARQPDDPVAQLLALQQHEDDEDDGQRQLAEVLQQRAEERRQARQPGGPLRLEDDGSRRGRCRRGRRAALVAPARLATGAARYRFAPLGDVRDHLLEPARAFRGLLDRLHLVPDRLAVLGQFPEQTGDLGGDQPADAAQRGRRQQDDHDHRRRPRQPALAEPVDQWAQQERQEGRQRHRDEDRLGPVERPDHDHRDHRAGQRQDRTLPARTDRWFSHQQTPSLARTPSYPPRRPGLRTREGRSFVVSNRGAKSFGARLAGPVFTGTDRRQIPAHSASSAPSGDGGTGLRARGRWHAGDSRWRSRGRNRSGWGRCPSAARRPHSESGRRTLERSPSSAPSMAGMAATTRWRPRGTAAGTPRSPRPGPVTSTATCWRPRAVRSRGSTPTPARSPTRRATA